MVEIWGIASSTITPPATEGGLTNVNISFISALGNTPSFTCKKGGGVPSMPLPAYPKELNFDIDGDDVIIHGGGMSNRNDLVITKGRYKTVLSVHKL